MIAPITFKRDEAAAVLRSCLARLQTVEGELNRIADIDGHFPHNAALSEGLEVERQLLRDAMSKLWHSSS